jgi:hypothetical protein
VPSCQQLAREAVADAVAKLIGARLWPWVTPAEFAAIVGISEGELRKALSRRRRESLATSLSGSV